MICQICSANLKDRITLTCGASGPQFGNKVTFLECPNCGFISAPENLYDFDAERAFDGANLPESSNGRAGSYSAPGREYFMAIMAHEILRGTSSPTRSILIYGAGMSLDHQWLSMKFPDIRVGVCDLSNFQEIDNFVPMDSTEKFDIVIACEVVEHFTDIKENFAQLLFKSSDKGIVVLSTNISDGTPLLKLAYPFMNGHTAYYSGRSLSLVAKHFDKRFNVDFRAPQAALAQLGPRKRYILMYRDEHVGASVPEFFSRNLLAPSEAATSTFFIKRLARRLSKLLLH